MSIHFFSLLVFCIFFTSVIFSVIWFSIYSVLWIRSTAPARLCVDKLQKTIFSGCVVLSGDPYQLGPVVTSSVAKELGLGISPLDRLMKNFRLYQKDKNGNRNPAVITKLCNNFRFKLTAFVQVAPTDIE